MRIYAGMPGERTVIVRSFDGSDLEEPLVIEFDKEGYVELEFPEDMDLKKLKSIIPGIKKPRKTKTKKDEE